MHTKNTKLEILRLRVACGFAFTVLLLMGCVGSGLAQAVQPRTFSSPMEASNALFEVAQKQDEAALEAILGAGKEVTSSSDEVEDKFEREQFSKKYQEMHRLVGEPDGSTVLYIGAENWPFPIPLVAKNGAWYFDSSTGMEEIKFRRIGENEAAAIQVCEEFAMTESEHNATREDNAKANSEDPITRFAQSLVSASAANVDSNLSAPFHGYYFRIVNGSSVAGANSYAAGGRKRGALALVAYPADYESSGVKTFIVSQKGMVFEKDLGPDTMTVAAGISVRSSDWRPAE